MKSFSILYILKEIEYSKLFMQFYFVGNSIKMRRRQTVNIDVEIIFCLQYQVAVSICKNLLLYFFILLLYAYLVDEFMVQYKPAGQTWTTILTSVSVRRRASTL